MHKLACLVTTCLLIGATLHAGSRPRVLLTIHTEVSEITHPDKRLEIPLNVPPGKFFVGKVPDIPQSLLIKIEHGTRPGAAMLTFDPSGTRLLRNITATNRGRRLAILLNGRVIFSPVIDATITNGMLYIPGGIFPQEFQQLELVAKQNARRFKNRPKPDIN